MKNLRDRQWVGAADSETLSPFGARRSATFLANRDRVDRVPQLLFPVGMATTSDVDTAAETAAGRHPLAFLARHYTIQASGVLSSLDRRRFEGSPRGSALDVVSWYHTLIAAKTYRALTSEHQAKANAPELLADALGSAKVVLVAIDRSLAAWQALATGDDAARVGALIELLEALRTAVELRFPHAQAFIPPALDDDAGAGDQVSGRAIGSDD